MTANRGSDDGGGRAHLDGDLQPDTDEVSAEMVVAASRRLAAAIADELVRTPTARVGRSVFGGILAVRTFVDDDPALPGILDEARSLAGNPSRPAWSLTVRTGRDSLVVLAHGDEWSLVGSSAGPVLVLPNWASHILRIDGDPDWASEITRVVTALIRAAQSSPRSSD